MNYSAAKQRGISKGSFSNLPQRNGVSPKIDFKPATERQETNPLAIRHRKTGAKISGFGIA
jgi:hypothetical protein